MTEFLEDLVRTLREEAVRYRKLETLALQQKDLLVAGKTEPLMENVRGQEKEVFALQPLAARRAELLQKAAKASGLKSLDLEGAVKQVSPEDAERLREAAREMIQAAKRLEAANRGNEKLLNNAMSYVDFSLKVLANGGRKRTTLSAIAAEKEVPPIVNRII